MSLGRFASSKYEGFLRRPFPLDRERLTQGHGQGAHHGWLPVSWLRTILSPETDTVAGRRRKVAGVRETAVMELIPDVHSYPLGVTSAPIFGKDLLCVDGDGPDKSTHTDQLPFVE